MMNIVGGRERQRFVVAPHVVHSTGGTQPLRDALSYTFSNNVFLLRFQEVGSIIGKKGEIVKRFREEVSASFFFFSVLISFCWFGISV